MVKTGLGYKAASLAIQGYVNSSKMLKNQENVESRLDKGYHAVPPPFTGNYMPPKRDLRLIDEHFVSVGDDRLKLMELIELSTKLSNRVLDLEKIKTAQAKEIADLKKRIKKLERKRRPKTLRMNLFKIGNFKRRSLGEKDASKQGRNLKKRSIFKESIFDVQTIMDADYELAARLRAEEQRRKPLTNA
uniref:Uncharacterized protein n=1 Tax=Tanacetum cinerariifolium TaxID=118510 RepID=A0A6L2LKQ2_TANCI|nr:hypothetical protein [Tanacetum cinerariifolium]